VLRPQLAPALRERYASVMNALLRRELRAQSAELRKAIAAAQAAAPPEPRWWVCTETRPECMDARGPHGLPCRPSLRVGRRELRPLARRMNSAGQAVLLELPTHQQHLNCSTEGTVYLAQRWALDARCVLRVGG
jgi:hypothetical protein